MKPSRSNHLPLPSAVVFVSEVKRLTMFYRALARMTVTHEDAEHSVLEIPGFQLVVHRLSREPRVVADKKGRVPVREDSYIKVCLPVDSIAAARAIAKTLGGRIKPVKSEWESTERGFRACDGHDPEGNVLQVRESL